MPGEFFHEDRIAVLAFVHAAYIGIDAVIDKDLASSVLASKINADMLLILTDVDGVYSNFGTMEQKMIPKLSKQEAMDLIKDPRWGAGSIAPKIKAGVEFAENGVSIITSPNKAIDAINGKAGTRISL